MNTSSVSFKNASDYITLLSNPMFLNVVKSALGNSEDDKSSALLSNLEKLSSLLPAEQTENQSSSLNLSSLLSSSRTSSSQESESSKYLDQSLDQIVSDLIANAELLESLINWDFEPSDDLSSLLEKFREIIAKLDEELGKLRQEVKDKEVKSELKLRPSNNTKSGFDESLALVAQ